MRDLAVSLRGYSVVPRPVFANDLLYFCTGHWTPLPWSPCGSTARARSAKIGSRFNCAGGVPLTPSTLVNGARLYMVSDQGVLTCANALTGKQLWRQRLGGNYSASLTLADGKIFVLSEDATMHVVTPGDEFASLATNQLDGLALATPAFVDGAIYLRTQTHLYRIESPDSRPAAAASTTAAAPPAKATARRAAPQRRQIARLAPARSSPAAKPERFYGEASTLTAGVERLANCPGFPEEALSRVGYCGQAVPVGTKEDIRENFSEGEKCVPGFEVTDT